jgi:hypothetical protein
MGHTVYPMRYLIYDKINSFRKVCNGLREPEKSIAQSLIIHLYQNISSISYANPLPNEIENNMLFSILLQEKKKKNVVNIDDLTFLVFSIIVNYKKKKNNEKNKIHYPNERNLNRLLQVK